MQSRSTNLRRLVRLRNCAIVRSGLTLAEVLVVIAIVGILLSLILPAIQSSREQARVVVCRSHLKQMVLAATAYEASHRAFPYTSTSWMDSATNPARRHFAVSAHRSLMPFLDPVCGRKVVFDDPTDPAWLSIPPTFFVSESHRKLQRLRLPFLLCPSDVPVEGATNFRANHGISVEALAPCATIESLAHKGAFVNGRAVPMAEFRDGLSQTALFSERVLGDRQPATYDPFRDLFSDGKVYYDTPGFVQHCRNDAVPSPPSEYSFAGGSWLLGGLLNTWYLHVLSPNSQVPDCALGVGILDGGPGIVTARSFHHGGVHVGMADGSVRFAANTIAPQVWHALGTRNGAESGQLH